LLLLLLLLLLFDADWCCGVFLVVCRPPPPSSSPPPPQSVGEARLLLRDWLVIFTTNYHRNSYMRASAEQLLKLPVRHSITQHDTAQHTSCPLLGWPSHHKIRVIYAVSNSWLVAPCRPCHLSGSVKLMTNPYSILQYLHSTIIAPYDLEW